MLKDNLGDKYMLHCNKTLKIQISNLQRAPKKTERKR